MQRDFKGFLQSAKNIDKGNTLREICIKRKQFNWQLCVHELRKKEIILHVHSSLPFL